MEISIRHGSVYYKNTCQQLVLLYILWLTGIICTFVIVGIPLYEWQSRVQDEH